MSFNVSFASPLFRDVDISSSVDVIKTVRGFWDEMAGLLKDYADLSLNPDPTKTFTVGHMQFRGDMVSSPAVALVLEDRLAKIEQAQSALFEIYNKMFTLEKNLNGSIG